jgi:hypothetical protein
VSSDNDYLFKDAKLFDFLGKLGEQMRAEIDQYGSDYVLKVSLDDLTLYLTDKFKLEPVSLLRDQTHIGESGDTKLDVSNNPRYAGFDRGQPCFAPATFAVFVVPFTGDARLLRHRPSRFNYNLPRGRIEGQELRFRYTRTGHDPAAMRTEFDRDMQNVSNYIAWGTEDVEQYNRGLPQQIRLQLDSRKEKFLKDRGLVEALGFPIKARAGTVTNYTSPVTRKRLPITKPTVPSGTFEPEPVLEMDHYEHILGVISSMVLVMERSPSSFARLDEEGLRTHILVQLNGHYEGQATGETFNAEGKTDILIRTEGRNIFIAECKFWKGAEVFKKTIDQLLGYTAWRDSKSAIIVFNRNKDTSAVVKQIPDLVKAHPNFKREVAGYKNETGFRFIMHHRDDKNRELTLTVMVLDVPA